MPNSSYNSKYARHASHPSLKMFISFIVMAIALTFPQKDLFAQGTPEFYAGFQMGPKADFYKVTNGSTEFVNTSAVSGATAGIILGATFEDKVLLETGLFDHQMQSSFSIVSFSENIQSEVTFPSLRTLLIPIRLNLFYPLKNNWNLYWGFGAYIMTGEQIERNPGISEQIVEQDASGNKDFLQYEISANYLTGSNIQVGLQAGAEKKLYDNIYICGEVFFRSAMSYINEYEVKYSSNNDRQRSVFISSRGNSPGVTIGLRYRPE